MLFEYEDDSEKTYNHGLSDETNIIGTNYIKLNFNDKLTLALSFKPSGVY